MSDSIVRAIPDITQEAPRSVTELGEGAHTTTHDIVEEPLTDSSDAILESLGIGDKASDLPSEDIGNLKEIEGYVRELLSNKGVTPTKSSVDKTLKTLKEDMGLDENADPQVVLDRIGGVIKSWKQLSFITNPREKRSLFMKLANATDSKEMNRLVFEEMSRKAVWR